MDLLPLFPLQTVLFPGAALPLRIFEPRYHAMLNDIGPQGAFGVVLIRAGQEAGPPAEPCDVGTTARIETVLDQGGMRFLQARGERRFRITRLVPGKPYLQGEVAWLPEPEPELPSGAGPDIRVEVAAMFADYLRLLGLLTNTPPDVDVAELMSRRERAGAWAMACVVGSTLLVPPSEKQPILEAARVGDALRAEQALLARETLRLRALARSITAGQN